MLIAEDDFDVNFHHEKPDRLPHISSAALTGNTEIIEILLKSGADATKIPMTKHPIYQVAIFGKMETMIFLLGHGINVRHMKDSDDKMHNIIYNLLLYPYNVANREEKVAHLLLHGASINLTKANLTASEHEKFINELIKIINCELEKDINIASSLLINILSNLTDFAGKFTVVANINLPLEQKNKINDIIKNKQDEFNKNVKSEDMPHARDYNDIKVILQATEAKNINEIYHARTQSLLHKIV